MGDILKAFALFVVCATIAVGTYTGLGHLINKQNNNALVTQAVCQAQVQDNQTWVKVLTFIQKRTLTNTASKNKDAAVAFYSAILAQLPDVPKC